MDEIFSRLQYLGSHPLTTLLVSVRTVRDEKGAETDRTKCCHICFHILCESRNEYGNTRNKYENRYFRKQIWNEYSANADEKQMIVGTKRQPKACRKSQENQKTCALNLSRLLGVIGG
jgi:hypothetical protein